MQDIKRPIVVMGMHRSGTSMITGMLAKLGLFVGHERSRLNEALFFLDRNERILKACNGGWDNPSSVDALLNHAGMRERLGERLRKDISSFQAFSYLGPRYFKEYGSMSKLDFPWGWKDPRNTFLLPLWLDIFPDARIIHVFRNGIDVAQSLALREHKRINRILEPRRSLFHTSMREVNSTRDKAPFLYAKRRLYKLLKKLDPLHEYDQFTVHPCISIDRGFQLWCAYVERGFEATNNKKNQLLNIKYESFVCEPENHLKSVQKFCGLPQDDKRIRHIARDVNRDRTYAFKSSESLTTFYEGVKGTYWMRKLGYSEI